MKKISKSSIAIFLILIVILVIIAIVIVGNNNKPKEQEVQLQEGQATENVILKDIEFNNITSSYAGGITTIRAKMHNNSNTSQNINIEILLKDSNGKVVGNMRQNIENVEVGKNKVFVTGITGDYSNISDIEIRVVE